MIKVTVGEMSYEGTAEEIKELFEVLGAEFPDGVVEDEKPAKYKEGDYVHVTEDVDEHKEGDVLEIIGTAGFSYYDLQVRNVRIAPNKSHGYTGYVFEKHIEPLEFIEGDPKVGDKILITSGISFYSDYENGDVLEVTEVTDGDNIKVRSDGEVLIREEFEIISRKESEDTSLKNGDKVRLLHGGNEGSAQGFYNGKIYEVVDVNWIVRDGEHRVCIGEVGGTNEGYVDIEQLEKVEETTGEDLLAEAKAKFPIGAKVRITIPEDEETEFYRDGVTNDEVGTVLEVRENFKGDKVIVSVDFDSRHRYWDGIPSELDVVTEQVPTEEIEEGDIIATEFYGILEVYGINEYDYHEIKVRINGRDDALERVACKLVAKKSDRKDV